VWKGQAGGSELLKQEQKSSTSSKFVGVAPAMNARLEKKAQETEAGAGIQHEKASCVREGTGNRKGVIWRQQHGTRLEAFARCILPESHDCPVRGRVRGAE
jgi:hypothetical protein